MLGSNDTDGAAGLRSARRRVLRSALAVSGASLLAGCETVKGWIPSMPSLGAVVGPTPPAKPTYGFDSGAQLYVLRRDPVIFHSYVAPEAGLFACSHVIELRDRLIVYDAQLTPALARELRYYANTLNKRYERLILSHEHADHWSGWAEFEDVPTFAARELEPFFAQTAPKMPARPGVKAPKLAGGLAHGDEMIAGARMEVRIWRDAEAAAHVTLGFPQQSVWIAGDLVYAKVHPFLGHRQFARWNVLLDQAPDWARSGAIVLPGHGAPTSSEAIAEMKRYLSAAQDAFARYRTVDEIEAALKLQFPDFRGNYYLRFGIDAALKKR